VLIVTAYNINGLAKSQNKKSCTINRVNDDAWTAALKASHENDTVESRAKSQNSYSRSSQTQPLATITTSLARLLTKATKMSECFKNRKAQRTVPCARTCVNPVLAKKIIYNQITRFFSR
jgi:pullulanase/glycogen debranching enzyme